MIRFLPVLALLFCVDGPATALEPPRDARVEAVTQPAWLLRTGTTAPLRPGAILRPGDEISTGPAARALVQLSDGSRVKLGADAKVRLDRLESGRAAEPFRAVLAVLTGAFRFTTEVLARERRREVDIRFGTITAGIRGTDLWGKVGAERDLVCLIEGHITASREGSPAADLTRPRSAYVAAPGQDGAVQEVSTEQLTAWSAETEILPGQGALRVGGRWHVVAQRSGDQAQALAIYDRLRQAGHSAVIRPRADAGGTVYAVEIDALPSRAEALALARRLENTLPGLSLGIRGR